MLDVKLVVIGGGTEGDEFQLDLPCIVGRARDVPIALPHPLVSRHHCELMERDGHLFVRDLQSTNGTFVGRERIEESIVQHGDLLTIGTVTLRATFAGNPLAFSLADSHHSSVRNSADETETQAINRIDTDVVPLKKHSGRPTGSPPHRRKQKAK